MGIKTGQDLPFEVSLEQVDNLEETTWQNFFNSFQLHDRRLRDAFLTVCSYRIALSFPYDPREDLFDMLDVDGKGEISQVEFADGLLNLLTQLE